MITELVTQMVAQLVTKVSEKKRCFKTLELFINTILTYFIIWNFNDAENQLQDLLWINSYKLKKKLWTCWFSDEFETKF